MLKEITKAVETFYASEISCNPEAKSKIEPTARQIALIYDSFVKEGNIEVKETSFQISYDGLLALLKKIFTDGKVQAKFETVMKICENPDTADAISIRACKISKISTTIT